jgi:chemotaxis protein methyltransferase CheR
MSPTPEDIQAVATLVQRLCGIVIGESKGYLVETRLGRLATEVAGGSYVELCRLAARDADLQSRFIDAITTNETLFFRDDSPFDVLRHRVIPMVVDRNAGTGNERRLRIWSSACATGQEPYSLSIILHELLPDIESWDVKILATDISEQALRHAEAGVYSQLEVDRGMPEALLRQYFVPQGDDYRIMDRVRSIITFQRLNLLLPFPSLGPFDVVLCRNVAIYFESDVQQDLFNRLSDTLVDDGYLFVGASESLTRFGERFQPQMHCRATYYQPNVKQLPRRAA